MPFPPATAGAMAEKFVQALGASFSPDGTARKEAGEFLQAERSKPGTCPTMLRIIKTHDLPKEIRLAAALYLKNTVRQWGSESNFVSEEDKKVVRSEVVDVMVAVYGWKGCVSVLEDCVKIIAVSDYPDNWQDVLPWIMQNINTPDNFPRLYAALSLLRQIARKYELRGFDTASCAPLEDIVATTFKPLLSLAVQLSKLDVASDEIAILTKHILKIYWSATQFALTDNQEVYNTLDHYMELAEKVILIPVPSERITSQACVEDIEALPIFKTKKWALQIIHRCFARCTAYSSANQSKMQKACLDHFKQKWATRLMDVCLEMLRAERTSNTYLTRRMKSLTLQYLTASLELSNTFKHIQPNLEEVLFQTCFPLLCYGADEEDEWESSPHSVLPSSQDLQFNYGCPREAAINFLQTAARLRGKSVLEPTMMFAESVLTSYNSSQDKIQMASKKDGAFIMIGNIAERLTSKKRNLLMEPFLINHVNPELNGPHKFLRMRACWLYFAFAESDSFDDKKIKQPEKIVEAFHRILACMNDTEIPVRLQAGESIQPFFKRSIALLDKAVIESIPHVMKALLSLLTIAEAPSGVSDSLQELIEVYEEEVPPYAIDIVESLFTAFMAMVERATVDEQKSNTPANVPLEQMTGDEIANLETEGDLSLAAMGLLRAINSTMATLTRNREVFTQLEPRICTIVSTLFKPDMIEFISEGLMILANLTFYIPTLTQHLWRYFDLIYQAVCGGSLPSAPLTEMLEHGWAPDFMNEMLPIIDNYMSRDIPAFLNGRGECGLTHVEMVVNLATKAINDPLEPNDGLELLCLMYESLIFQPIDPLLPIGFKLSYDYLQKCVTHARENPDEDERSDYHLDKKRIALILRLWGTMMFYNPVKFCEVMGAHSPDALTSSLTFWFKNVPAIRSIEGKKVFILAFSKILCLIGQGGSSSQLPALLTGENEVKSIIHSLVTEADAIEELKEKRSKAEEEGDDSDDSEQELDETQDAVNPSRSLLAKLKAAG
eukprot:GHVN01053740.1.p1 GENE.GHVN01053740.1~~GHVN01053740.1.p1  ORF type:complete len:1007 (+),score=188.64 GHVN01053740.1:50-3070(+)